MGSCAELLVTERNYSREDQDKFAIHSYLKALEANKKIFENEIIPISIKNSKGKNILIKEDEEPFKANLEKVLILNLFLKRVDL